MSEHRGFNYLASKSIYNVARPETGRIRLPTASRNEFTSPSRKAGLKTRLQVLENKAEGGVWCVRFLSINKEHKNKLESKRMKVCVESQCDTRKAQTLEKTIRGRIFN